jgi:hypothetical protein
MIFLNREESSVFKIEKDLVVDYKRTGDQYLVSIYHELTKQLIPYTVYNDLQKVDNYFYMIIKGLLYEEYTDIEKFRETYSIFVKKCDIFLKNSKESFLTDDNMKVCDFYIDKLKLLMQKLMYIAENICYGLEEQ